MPTEQELRAMVADERTPLLSLNDGNNNNGNNGTAVRPNNDNKRQQVYNFLEAQTPAGMVYEKFMMGLIGLNVICFIVGSLFVTEYNPASWANRTTGLCRNTCDALWFGNYRDNGLGYLQLGSTSVLELCTVTIFTVELLLRLWTADLEDPIRYGGFVGRLRYLTSFFAMIDLASTVPFYLDAIVFRQTDLAASQFLRMFRLLRMMRVEGRYDTALTMIDDVIRDQRGVLGTAGFVGITVWIVVSALYYLAERRNYNMIYCPACSNGDDNFDAAMDCTIDSWGIVECNNCTGCYQLYESIPMASYYALLNLFGEFPHIDTHNFAGKVVGTFTAVVAVAVFALPAGIIGNGFEDVIAARRSQNNNSDDANNNNMQIVETGGMTDNFHATSSTFRGRAYNFLFAQTVPGSGALELFINILIVATAVSFMLDTLGPALPASVHVLLDSFELVSVTIFTIEYGFRLYAAKEDPKYNGPGGRVKCMLTFLAVVDLLSFLPFWIEVAVTGRVISATADSGNSTFSNVVKSLRLCRILRFERYTHAFLTFDDVISRNLDVLAVTAFTALLFWIFFSACLYFSERDSLDEEMASNYSTVPNSMWITLLNLSGEAPLSQYSFWGKVVTAILGLFATGVFGIPIGVLGAGFEEIVEEENLDNTEELRRAAPSAGPSEELGTPIERSAYKFVNGIGSPLATWFELLIYALIILSVAVGAWQTVEGEENAFHEIEWIAVIIFTIEYTIRLVGAGADPEFARAGENWLMCRLRFILSFYSIIDLLAIVPFYLALALPNSIVDQYDEYLRMLRILRLVKLDKYVPSITLIDDVVRLKFNTLRVAVYAAGTLWILFTALLFLCEHKDYWNSIDPVPEYGCDESCTMADRFRNFFDSMVYTGVHLTGDYPIITYTWPARFVNFFMVIAAVGVVSIPSGVIASGFVEILQTKNKKRRGEAIHSGGMAGDDWYEESYRLLDGVEPPPSKWGPKVDAWQFAVNDFLNGKQLDDGRHEWTKPAFAGRIFMFTVIIANIVAVLLESVPTIDKAVGNEPGNFFDRFELFSVMVFAAEYMLRLFCAPKNREALYSSFVYATTFFGIVDFLSTAPWFIEHALIATGIITANGDSAMIFRIFRIFRILQLEDFVVAFSKLDNVFRASKDVLKATGLMAAIVWVGCGALFFIFEENNPNWRSCDSSIPLRSDNPKKPGCYDFNSTKACNEVYSGMCYQNAFTDMPNALFFTAVFLGGEWGLIDFTFFGRAVCLFLCVIGIALYSIPVGTLFDSFGAVLGLVEEDEEDEGENNGDATKTNELRDKNGE